MKQKIVFSILQLFIDEAATMKHEDYNEHPCGGVRAEIWQRFDRLDH